MSTYWIFNISKFVTRVTRVFNLTGLPKPPPTQFNIGVLQEGCLSQGNMNNNPSSLTDLIDNSILWAVPKHRRSVEKRLNRKFGNPYYVWKLLKPKTNLQNCTQCGSSHEIGVLCPNCCSKIRKQTIEMQDQIKNNIGITSAPGDAIVLCNGKENNQNTETMNEMIMQRTQKPRQPWFGKNLTQKSEASPVGTSEIKPNKLG